MKKKTRKEKIKMNPKGGGQSKYSLKVKKRKRTAARLGVDDMPMPILKLQEE